MAVWTKAQDAWLCQAMTAEPRPTYQQLVAGMHAQGWERTDKAITARVSKWRKQGRITGDVTPAPRRSAPRIAPEPPAALTDLPVHSARAREAHGALTREQLHQRRLAQQAAHGALVARVIHRVFPQQRATA